MLFFPATASTIEAYFWGTRYCCLGCYGLFAPYAAWRLPLLIAIFRFALHAALSNRSKGQRVFIFLMAALQLSGRGYIWSWK